jgi:hypothetical protein
MQMEELYSRDTRSQTLPFGKHAGKSFNDIMEHDISYCNWVLRQINVRGVMKSFQDYLKIKAKHVTCEACNGTGHGHTM